MNRRGDGKPRLIQLRGISGRYDQFLSEYQDTLIRNFDIEDDTTLNEGVETLMVNKQKLLDFKTSDINMLLNMIDIGKSINDNIGIIIIDVNFLIQLLFYPLSEVIPYAVVSISTLYLIGNHKQIYRPTVTQFYLWKHVFLPLCLDILPY